MSTLPCGTVADKGLDCTANIQMTVSTQRNHNLAQGNNSTYLLHTASPFSVQTSSAIEYMCTTEKCPCGRRVRGMQSMCPILLSNRQDDLRCQKIRSTRMLPYLRKIGLNLQMHVKLCIQERIMTGSGRMTSLWSKLVIIPSFRTKKKLTKCIR